jgi:hypothetical protein
MPAPWGGTDAPPATGGGAAEPRQVEADLDQPEAADERPEAVRDRRQPAEPGPSASQPHHHGGRREFLGARAGFLAPPRPTRARAARLTSAPLRPTCLCTTQPSRSVPSALCALVGTVSARRQLHRQRRRSRRRVLGLDRLELHRPPAVAAARGRRWRRRRRRWRRWRRRRRRRRRRARRWRGTR